MRLNKDTLIFIAGSTSKDKTTNATKVYKNRTKTHSQMMIPHYASGDSLFYASAKRQNKQRGILAYFLMKNLCLLP